MLHLMKYCIKVKLKNFNMLFWPLVFPLILGTLFYVAFGTIEEADFETVPVGVVEEKNADLVFIEFLDRMAEEDEPYISCEKLEYKEASKALSDGKISGIYVVGEEIKLTVGGNGIPESILQSLLDSYENGKQTMIQAAASHPEGIEKASEQMEKYNTAVKQVSLGGKTTNGNAQFFYALIGMACLYGAFIGVGAALWLQANLTTLAARRSVTPTHKLKLVIVEMLSSFLLHFVNVCILLLYLRYVLKLDFQGQMPKMLLVSMVGCLIGVSMGIFIGSFGQMGEGVKIGILLGISMTCSFLAGLMNADMKYAVEKSAPIINRLNPAALITDAFYCINVYDDPIRFTRSLVILTIMAAVLTGASFLMVRRERYVSI